MSDPRYSRVGSPEVRLMEECAEVIQIASKAVRFGWEDRKPGQDLTNAERIELEMRDLVAVWNEIASLRGIRSLKWGQKP